MNNLAFLVSCEEYSRDEVVNLSGVKEDVQRIGKALIQYCGVSEENCHYLCDSEGLGGSPTESELWNLLELSCDSEKYDTIYFYFSGHGFQNRDNELCIMTRDSRLSPYPMMYTKVGDIAKFIKSTYDYKYIIFILDMCQTYRNDAKGALDIEFPYGIITICSCLPDSESYLLPESEERGSLFTYCFVKTLEMSNANSTIGKIVKDTREKMLAMDKHNNFGQICYLDVECFDLGNMTLGDLCGNKEGEEEKQPSIGDVFEEQEKYISYIPKTITNFWGRKQELQWLYDKVKSSNRPIFLSGDGGMGKTMITLRFAEIHSEYIYCFVVFHNNIFHTIASIRFSNHLISGIDYKNLSEKQLYERNMQLLESYGNRLVFFIDNFDSENYDITFFELIEQKPDLNMSLEFKNENIFERLIKSGIHIIITTRLKVPTTNFDVYDIKPMSTKMLTKFIIDSCDSIEFDQRAKDTLAHIIEAIDGLTIITELIVSVLQKQGNLDALYALSDIILNEKYQEDNINVESVYDFKNTTIYYHLQSVFNFFGLSEEASKMLRVVSLLPNGGISTKLFYDLNRDTLNVDFKNIIHSLNDLRLININRNRIYMHPVISTFVKFELKPDANNCKKFLESLLGAYHTDATEEYGREFIEEICLTLAQAAKRIDKSQMKAELYSKAGIIARRSGMYLVSKEMELMAISTLESVKKPDYKKLATYHSNIANLFLDMADLDSAERHQNEAICIRKKILGENHPDIAMSYCNMALILAQKAKYQDAMEYQEEAIKILENTPEVNKLSLAIAYDNMAQISYDQELYETALNWEKKALGLREQFLDSDSHYLAVSYNNISLYFHKVGNEDEAEKYVKKAIDIQERILGLNHPYLAISYNNLALVLKAKGDYQEAIKYQLKDIAIKQEGTKNDHWNMATSFDNLAELMILTNNYQEARNYQEQAIEIRENVQGKSHPDLIKSYQNMIVILENLGDLEKIAQYYSKLSQIQK